MHIYNSVLNEITTTHEECIKYNFVAPLSSAVYKRMMDPKMKYINLVYFNTRVWNATMRIN